MKNPEDSDILTDLKLLRTLIQRKYETYHARNRDQFPLLDFNTNRANYQPLRDSFEIELFEVQQISRSDERYHIPSLSSMTLLFTNDDYVPNPKVFNTLSAYITPSAEHPSTPIGSELFKWIPPIYTHKYAVAGSLAALLLVCLAVFGLTLSRKSGQLSPLLIDYPKQGQLVSRLLKTGGKAAGAEFVWVVVHLPETDSSYYLQGPFPVKHGGNWSGELIVGPAQITTDLKAEVRAFVNPKENVSENMTTGRYRFDSWPAYAESATEPVLVTRKANRTEK